MSRILADLVAGLHHLGQNRDLVLVLIVAEKRGNGILAGDNIFGWKPCQSQCAYVGHTPFASTYIVLLHKLLDILTQKQKFHNIDKAELTANQAFVPLGKEGMMSRLS